MSNIKSSLDIPASIKSGYYLNNKQYYSTLDTAWNTLKQYVNNIKELSGFTDNDETIIINETTHTIQIITKNKKLPLDRYVPIKKPVILDPLSGNIKGTI